MEEIIWKYSKRKINIYIMYCEGRPLALHCAKYFMYIFSFNLFKMPLKKLSPFPLINRLAKQSL